MSNQPKTSTSSRPEAGFGSGTYRLSVPGTRHDELLARESRTGAMLRVVALTPAGLSLESIDGFQFEAGETVEIELQADVEPLTGRVAELARDGAAAMVSFADLPIETARDLAAVIQRRTRRGLLREAQTRVVESESIRSPARVRDIVRALFANRCQARARVEGGAVETQSRLRPAKLEPEHGMSLHWDVDGPWPRTPFVIEAVGFNSVYRFEVVEASEHDGFLAVPAPSEITRIRSRRFRRAAAPPDVFVTFRHPRWPELLLRRQAIDLSFEGVGFGTNALKDLLYPGLVLDSVAIDWQDRLRIEMRGVVRHISDDLGGPAEIAGLQLVPDSPEDRAHWIEQIYRLFYPNTQMDGSFARDLWGMYEDSGYFGLSNKAEQQFRPLRQPFASTGRCLAAAPDLGCQVVWPSARGVEASVSMLKVYERATFLYQLARQHGRTPLWSAGRQILREIYMRAIEHVQRDESLQWMVVWIQVEARFSRLVHHDLPLRYVADGRASITRFRALEGSCVEAVAPPALEPGWEIGAASAQEITALLAMIARTRPAPYVEAHDFVASRFDLQGLKNAWSAAGLTRDRSVIVARRNGTPMAAAVLEYADDGLHLFGLLDAVRVFPLHARGEFAFTALLESARGWYHARGKQKFVYVQEAEDLAHAPRAGFTDLGLADATVLPAGLFAELLEHVYEITAPRDVPPVRSSGG